MAAKRVRFQATECTNDIDLVSQTGWAEEAPSVFIAFPGRDPEAPRKIMCYNGPKLAQWILDENNTFARWVQKNPSKPMEDTGHYGAPSDDPRERYWKLYTGEFVLVDKVARDIISSETPYMFDADPIGIERVGNLQGTFGVSMLHGQAPGVTIYELSNFHRVQVVSNPEIDALRGLSFLDLIKKVPLELVDKYPTAVLMAARDAYLDEQYHRHAQMIVDSAKGIIEEELKTFIAFEVKMNGEEYELLRHSVEVPSMFSAEGRLTLERSINVNFSLILNSADKWEFNCVSSQKSLVLNRLAQQVSNLRMVNDIFEYLLRYMPGSSNVIVVGTTMFSLLGEEANDLYEGVIKKYDKYFTTKTIENVLGIVPSVATTKLYDEHGTEILDRLLQLFGRKQTEKRLAAYISAIDKENVGGIAQLYDRDHDSKLVIDALREAKGPFTNTFAVSVIQWAKDTFEGAGVDKELVDEIMQLANRFRVPKGKKATKVKATALDYTNAVNRAFDAQNSEAFIGLIPMQRHNYLSFITAVREAARNHPVILIRFRENIYDALSDFDERLGPEDVEVHNIIQEILGIFDTAFLAAKGVKAKSPGKVMKAKSPSKVKAIAPPAQLVDAFQRGDDAAIVAAFPASSDDYARYFENLLDLMTNESASLTPQFAGRLFMSLTPIRARLVPAANYEVETDLLRDIRQRLQQISEGVAPVPKVVKAKAIEVPELYNMIAGERNVAILVDMVMAEDIVRSLNRLRDAAREVLADGLDVDPRWSSELIAALNQAISGEGNDDAEDIINELEDIFEAPPVKAKAAKKTVKAAKKAVKAVADRTVAYYNSIAHYDIDTIHTMVESGNVDDELAFLRDAAAAAVGDGIVFTYVWIDQLYWDLRTFEGDHAYFIMQIRGILLPAGQ